VGCIRIEATYNWKGSIAGNGLAGARVEMIKQVLDLNGNLITSYDIHEKEIRESAFQIGGIIDQETRQVVVDFTLPQGKTGFNIRCNQPVQLLRLEQTEGNGTLIGDAWMEVEQALSVVRSVESLQRFRVIWTQH